MNKSETFTNNKKSGLLPFRAPRKPVDVSLDKVGRVVGKGVKKASRGLTFGLMAGKIVGMGAIDTGGKVVNTVGKGINKASLNFFKGMKEELQKEE